MAKSSNNDTTSIPSPSILVYRSHHDTYTFTSADDAALPTCLIRDTIDINNLDAVTATIADARLKASDLGDRARFDVGIAGHWS